MTSSPDLGNRGAIANVLSGYGHAWRHLPRLLAVLAPILLPVILIRLVVRVLATGEEAAIVNGVMLLPREEPASWLELALVLAGWMWAVGAATIVVAGVLRGIPVRAGAAVLSALYRTPVLAVTLLLIGLGWFAVTAVGGLLGPVIAVAALVSGGLAAARLLLAVPSIMLRGNNSGVWAQSRGRAVTIVGTVVLGVFAIPSGLLWLTDQVTRLAVSGVIQGAWAAAVLPAFTQTLGAVGLTAVAAGQAGTLAMAYLVRREATDTGAVADLDAVDDRLGDMANGTAPPRRWGWVHAASLMLPALLLAGVTLVNPHSATSVNSRPANLASVAAIGWPEGGHPVIITLGAVRFCHDDECREYTTRTSRVSVMAGHGAAAVGADGSAVMATTGGSQETGGPFVHLGRCTIDGCRHSWVPVRASSDEEFTWPEVGVGAAPDGTIFIGFAMERHDATGASTVELKLMRCEDVTCAKPQRHSFGVVEGSIQPEHQGRRRVSPNVRLRFDASGWPVINYQLGGRLWKATCSPSTCDGKRLVGHLLDGYPHVALPGVDAGVLGLGHSQLWHCRGDRCTDTFLEGCCIDARLSGLAYTGSGTLAVFAGAAPPREGVHIRFGAPEPDLRHRLVLWHCPDLGCSSPRRIPLIVTDTELKGLWTVERDGKVLIVASDWNRSRFVSLTLT